MDDGHPALSGLLPKAFGVLATASPSQTATVPWTAADLSRVVWTSLLAAAGVLLSYLEVSATPIVSRQIAWLAVGIGMLALAGVGNAFFLTQGARATRLRTRRLIAELNAYTDEPSSYQWSGSGPSLVAAFDAPQPSSARTGANGFGGRPAAGTEWIELLEETRRNHRRRASRRG